MTERDTLRANPEQVRSLQEAIRRLQTLDADRADAASSIRDTQRARLELLAEELAGVFDAVPASDADQFTFAVQRSDPPRLWIDATSHVAIGRDHRTYRFVKDARLGRTIIAESADRGAIADAVTDYVAARILERRRALESDWAPESGHADARAAPAAEAAAAPMPQPPPRRSGWGRRFGLILSHLLFALIGAAALYAYAQQRGVTLPLPIQVPI